MGKLPAKEKFILPQHWLLVAIILLLTAMVFIWRLYDRALDRLDKKAGKPISSISNKKSIQHPNNQNNHL
jgi:hypothetical protein